MNTKSTAIALMALAASIGSTSGFATQPEESSPSAAEERATTRSAPSPRTQSASRTRAEVKAELKDARAKGEVVSGETTNPAPASGAPSNLTRKQVRAEGQAARKAGTSSPHEGD